MFCPVLEHEIQAHKKAAEIARELSRTGYCYIEVTTKSGECLISEIVSMTCGEFKNKKLEMCRSKKYKTVNGYWSDTYNAVLEQYDTDIELDEPVINSSIL